MGCRQCLAVDVRIAMRQSSNTVEDTCSTKRASQPRAQTHLCRVGPERGPVEAGQDVEQHLLVDLDVVLHELRVLRVEGVRVRGGLARLDGARQEI